MCDIYSVVYNCTDQQVGMHSSKSKYCWMVSVKLLVRMCCSVCYDNGITDTAQCGGTVLITTN